MELWQIKERVEVVNVEEHACVDVLEDVFARKIVFVDVVVEKGKTTAVDKFNSIF